MIADPTCLDTIQRASFSIAHVATIVAQEKTRSYAKHATQDDFIPLVIEAYDCLHSHFDSFLTSCVQATIACRP